MSLLDTIRIATPCTMPWSEMTGDDRTRHCKACDKTVFDLSSMTRVEAERLLVERGSTGVCARFYERGDGTIVLADCLVRKRRSRRAVSALAGLTALAGAGAIAVNEITKAPEVEPMGALDLVEEPDFGRAAYSETQSENVELAPGLAFPRVRELAGTISFDITVDESEMTDEQRRHAEAIRAMFAPHDE